MNEDNTANPEPPKLVNPDGTTNWIVVFDDPVQGIVAAVSATQSVEQLRSVMQNVALLLFKRKRDDEPRAEFLAMINNVIAANPEDSIEVITARITRILDAEKNLRIEKAALHAKNKAASQSIERRRSSTHEGFFSNPVNIALAIGGLLIAALVAIMGFYYFMMTASNAPAEAENEQPPAKAEAPAELKTPEKKAPPKNQFTKLALKPVLITVNTGGSPKRLSLVPLLDIESDEKISPTCAFLPRIMESILFRLGPYSEQGKDIDAAVLREVSARVTKDINARSGAQKIGPMILVDSRKLPSKILLQATRGCERVTLEQLP